MITSLAELLEEKGFKALLKENGFFAINNDLEFLVLTF
jgi:hypothetical protein